MTFVLFLVLMLVGPASSYAATCYPPMDICEDINDLSNCWNEIANRLAEGEEVEDFDAEAFDAAVQTMLEATVLLGAALVEAGNEDEQVLGSNLLDVIVEADEIGAEELEAYIVDILDDLVDALDAIVDYCDEE
jgi:hypothetical protein